MTISRRGFLRSGAGVVAASAGLPAMLMGAGREADAERVLVVVELNGGNDALNTLIPVHRRDYAAARPTLAIQPADALMLDNHVGLHPAMDAMHKLYRQGQLAVIQGVGYPNPSRSHFRSMEIWHRGTLEADVTDGWLGRHLEPARKAPPFIHCGTELPEMFKGTGVAAIGISDVEEVHPLERSQRSLTVSNLLLTPTHDATGRLTGASRPLQAALRIERRPAAYPSGRFGQGLAAFAQLIVRDAGPRMFHVSLGGFDTHAKQAETHADLLGTLSSGIGAFLADVRSRDVLVMVFSEFGRRLRENSSAGTDHGSAGVMFMAGQSVRGGLYGRYPSLTDLDEGDLKYTTDFRDCHAAVLAGWLGTPSNRSASGVQFV